MDELSLLGLLAAVALVTIAVYMIALWRLNKDLQNLPEQRSVDPSLPPIFLSTIPPTERQRQSAMWTAGLMVAAFAILTPFANVDLPVIQAFTPVGDALLFVIYLVVAVILIGQFRQLRTWSMLTLASGFLFQAMIALGHGISFPGFIPDLETHAQTTSWLYVIWRGGFPIFIVAYALLHRRPRPLVRLPVALALSLAIGSVVLFTIGLSAFAAIWNSNLPIVVGDNYRNLVDRSVSPILLGANLLALLALWWCSDSVLDIWLMVAATASVLDIAISVIIGNERYDLSYYSGRIFGLLSAAFILAALVDEMNWLYASLITLVKMQKEESEALYRSIVDTATDGIILIDTSGTMSSFNHAAEKIFGYNMQETIGKNVNMLMPESIKSVHDGCLANYLLTGERKIIGIGREVQGQHKDGRALAIDLSIAEWYKGDQRFFTGIVREISDRKRLETQLVQSQKMEAIGQLTGGMAHDFNNILGVVVGNLDMLSENYPEGESPIELREAINASTAGADLVRRLLAFARRQPLLPKVINLQEIVSNLLPLLDRTIGEAIQVQYELDDKLPFVLVDPTQFETALINLVINARDAMPNGGKLTIELRRFEIDEESSPIYEVPVGTYSTLVVSDTGAGIPPEVLPHVFEPFFTTKPPGTGNGLGLSMVFGYAKQSGGIVRIYSEVGKGTSVRLYLPSVCHADEGMTGPPVTDTGAFHGDERILVVEDSPGARMVAQRILASLGYHVTVVQDASEAIAALDSGQEFDLMFTDVIMPGAMNGIALAYVARERHPMLKILLASGFSQTPIQEITSLGAMYITKPYRKYELATIVRSILDRK